MLRSNSRFSLKKVIVIVVLIGLVFGAVHACKSLTRPTSIAQIIAQPATHESQVVYIMASDARVSTPLLGHTVWSATDDAQNWVSVIGHDASIAGKLCPVIVHRPQVFGRAYLVLEQVGTPTISAWHILLQELGLGQKPGARPASTPVQAQPFDGTVVQENSVFDLKTFTVQGEDQQNRTYLSATGGLPVGAGAAVTAEATPALALLDGQALYVTKEAVVTIQSITSMAQAFDGRELTVEGQVGSGFALLGQAVYTLRDQQGSELVVLGGGGSPATGTSAKVSGTYKYLAGIGTTSWSVLYAAAAPQQVPAGPAVTPPSPSSPATPPPAVTPNAPGASSVPPPASPGPAGGIPVAPPNAPSTVEK